MFFIYAKTNLQRFNHILNQKDWLEFQEEVIELGEKSISHTGDLISREGDINIQELLKLENCRYFLFLSSRVYQTTIN